MKSSGRQATAGKNTRRGSVLPRSRSKNVSMAVRSEDEPAEEDDHAQEEVERVVADVDRGAQPADLARELGQPGAGVDRAVDQDRVDDLPEPARQGGQGTDDEPVVDLVDVVLVDQEAVHRREAR